VTADRLELFRRLLQKLALTFCEGIGATLGALSGHLSAVPCRFGTGRAGLTQGIAAGVHGLLSRLAALIG
jgi:hypothetical protein